MITRWTTYETAIIPDKEGEYILYEDYLQEVTELEYENRFLREQLRDRNEYLTLNQD